MSTQQATLVVEHINQEEICAHFSGNWLIDALAPEENELETLLDNPGTKRLTIISSELQWDSRLVARLLTIKQQCKNKQIQFDLAVFPQKAQDLLQLASAVPPNKEIRDSTSGLGNALISMLHKVPNQIYDHLVFAGDITRAYFNRLTRRYPARWSETLRFCYQAGPQAIPIITLQSVLVGMILAYLGILQLSQFGAEVYISDLVAIGMVREMGALMVGIIMSGRTGAAYAAQLGTMQVNEEVDALITLGIKPVDYLVLPRITALIITMPLLCLYSNVLGMLGGGLISTGMDMTWRMYLYQLSTAITATDVLSGLFKSLVFAMLIAVAGCHAGLKCGRSSAAVGNSTTSAVVTAIIYLIVADAVLNLLYFNLGV